MNKRPSNRLHSLFSSLRHSFSSSDHRLVDLLIAIASFLLLAGISLIIQQPEVPPWEITGFRTINNLPDWLFPILWPFMQYGVFVTIPLVSVLALYFKRVRLAILLLLGGVGIYFIARYIKEVIPRGRPADILEMIQARETTAPGSTGFTSGHTAVAATIATFAHQYLRRNWQILSMFTLAIVVIGRIYVGAHLPLDVIGGVALGVAVASLINFIVGVPHNEPKVKEDTEQWLAVHRPRHPGDIIRIVIAAIVFAVTTLLAFGRALSPLEEALFRVINYLPGFISPFLEFIMQAGAYYFVFIAAAIALWFMHRRLALKMVFGGTLVWVLAKIAKELVHRDRPFYLLAEIVDRAGSSGLGFPSGHAAIAALLATVTAPYIPKKYRRMVWILAWTVAISRVYVGVHLPLDIFAGLALGWFFGSLLNLIFGTPAKKLPITLIKAKLAGTKFELKKLTKPLLDARGSTPLFGQTVENKKVFIKLFDSEHRNADVLYRLWRFISLRQIDDEAPFATAKQIAEHEAYVGMQAKQSGVRTPAIMTVSSMSDHSAMIVSEKVEGTILSSLPKEPSKKLLEEIWRQVAKLHANQIAHRDLRTSNIIVDKNNNPWLIDYSFAASSASNRQLTLDITELLVSSALLTQPKKAIDAAISVIGKDKVAQVLPYLQPLSLSSSTRRLVRSNTISLNYLATLIQRKTGSPQVKRARMRRVNYKWFWLIVIIGLSTTYLLPKLGELSISVDTIKSADTKWLLAAFLASISTYAVSTFVVLGSTAQRLSYWVTFVLQLATTVVNRITPKGVGGVALTEQYLERNGLTRTQATVSTTIIYTVGAMVHVALLAMTALLVDYTNVHIWSVDNTYVMMFIIVLAILSIATIMFKRVRSLMRRWYNEFMKGIREGLTNLKKLAQLFLGSAGITLSYVLAFYFSLEAFGSAVPFSVVLLIYLAGNAISSAAPTPSGLGALEAALVVGLSAADISLDQAIAGVLTFRLITFWLPILPGFIALRYINRTVFNSH